MGVKRLISTPIWQLWMVLFVLKIHFHMRRLNQHWNFCLPFLKVGFHCKRINNHMEKPAEWNNRNCIFSVYSSFMALFVFLSISLWWAFATLWALSFCFFVAAMTFQSFFPRMWVASTMTATFVTTPVTAPISTMTTAPTPTMSSTSMGFHLFLWWC